MGWNDHVEHVLMRCLDCGDEDVWELWDKTAIARYGGELGKKLGHDIEAADCCPNCRSPRGKRIEDDD